MIKSSRREFISQTVFAAIAGVLACGLAAGAEEKPRVVILGFDGMEPTIVDVMLRAGELPNFDALRKQGGYERLGTTIPPQSPAAWSSFATCRTTGNHGIFDFVRRTPKTYMPDVGFGKTVKPNFAPDGAVIEAAKSISYRRGETFWAVADAQGVRCKVLHVPFSYPCDHLTESVMLSGEGVPDIRGATTTFFHLSDAFTPAQLKERLSGGQRLELKFNGDTATVPVPGYPNRGQPGAYVEVPMVLTVDRARRTVTAEVQGQKEVIAENGWSKWLPWKFDVTPKYSVRAISCIHVLEAGTQVRLYMSSLQFHPKEPYVSFSAPPTYSGELADRSGLYKTIGWVHDTHALRQDVLSEDAFLEDAKNNDAWLEALTLDEFQRDGFQMLISVWTSTDRISHMFWRFRDPKHPLYTPEGAAKYGKAVEESYQRMDAILGKVAAKLKPSDLLLVLSDHGFRSFRKGFSVNTWLVRNDYLAVTGQPDPATACTDEDQDFLQGFDWSKSRVYGLGLGSIYLNLKNREGKGVVNPADAPALLAELRENLLQVRDPETGDKVFNAVYTRDEFTGLAGAEAPDLQLGYADGYQTAKASSKGAAPKELFQINTDKWSGAHESSDAASIPGILLCNKPIGKDPAIIDLGVTALKYLGVTVPKEFQGKPLL